MATCKQCGGLADEGRSYCKRACYHAAMVGTMRPSIRRRVQLTCQACGEQFEAGGRSGKSKNARFCKNVCKNAARWRTGSKSHDLTIAQAAYLAGMIDGEGSIILYRIGRGVAMRLVVSSTDRAVLEWCALMTGVGSIVSKKVYSDKHKPSFIWQVASQPAASIIEQVRPYLIIKAEQADMALDFQRKLHIPADKAEKEWQEQWRQRMRLLNARGPVAVA